MATHSDTLSVDNPATTRDFSTQPPTKWRNFRLIAERALHENENTSQKERARRDQIRLRSTDPARLDGVGMGSTMSRHTRRWPVRIIIAATFALLTFLVVVAFSADSTVEAQAASGDTLGDERPVQRSDARPESHPTADHTQFEILDQEFATDQDVTKACLSCHAEAAKQIMATTHWTWETDTAAFGEADVIGKKTQINNFCIGVESNEPRCTSCHTGYGWADDTFDFTAEENVDCLVCHDTTGTYKKFPTGAVSRSRSPRSSLRGAARSGIRSISATSLSTSARRVERPVDRATSTVEGAPVSNTAS